MNILGKLQEIVNNIILYCQSLDKAKLMFVIPLFLVFVLLIIIFDSFLDKRKVQKTFTVKRRKVNSIYIIRKNIKSKHFNRCINYIAKKLCMFNVHSLERNKDGALLIIFLWVGALFISFLVLIVQNTLWYVAFIYFITISGFLSIFFATFVFFVKGNFTKKLPRTFRIINARFITNRTIMEAINISLPDLDGSVKREMNRLYNALRKNDPKEIRETFEILEANYDNNYFSLLLMLIHKAHYKGGKDEIKALFSDAAEELLNELEHRKDIVYTSRIYIILSVVTVIIFTIIAERFNVVALGEYAETFFQSTKGIMIKLSIVVSECLFVALMLTLEKMGG